MNSSSGSLTQKSTRFGCNAYESAARLQPLNLSAKGREIALKIEESRWIFEHLLELMHEHAGSGVCGNIFFHHIDEPNCPDLVPKRVNLFHVAGRAKRAMEIGFNAGHSAAVMLLANQDLTLRAFDVCHHNYTRPCFEFLRAQFGDRLELIQGPSQQTVLADQGSYDLIHIDADHSYHAVSEDLAHSIRRAAEGAVFVLDDLEPGNEVERAVSEIETLKPAQESYVAQVHPGSGHAFFEVLVCLRDHGR